MSSVLLTIGLSLFSACAHYSEHAHSTDVLFNQEWKEYSQMEGIFNIEQGFQGLTLEGPDIVYLTEMEAGRFIWDDSSKPAETTYTGVLNISGYFSVFVPDGMQNEIWADLSDNIEFVVKDLKSEKVQRRNRVAGGWNAERMGISMIMAEPPDMDLDYSGLPGNTVYAQPFLMEVFDDLPDMPIPDTELEIHAEYMGFVSNTIRIEVKLKNADEVPDQDRL